MSDEAKIADDLQWLSKVYRLIGQPQQAVEASHQALLLAQLEGDPARWRTRTCGLMQCLGVMEHYAKAYEQREKAESTYNRRDDRQGLARGWWIKGELLLAHKRFADALPFLVKAQRNLTFTEGDPIAVELRQDLVQVHIGLGELRIAGQHLDSLNQMLAGRKDREHRLAFHQLAYQLAEAQQ
ncbi:MAG: hypothetical protein IPH53_17310 [Flavobacteriales bacterium]|nr:hypothetical protein [Flavobacteriales bacterium]